MATTRKKTKYNLLQKAASKACENPSQTTKSRLKKATESYKKDASKNGKSSADIMATIRRVTSCKVQKRK